MKARLPEGMGRGPGNMQSMLRQAQKMQEDMAKLQEELDAREYTARSGGGAVTAVVDGKHRLKTLEIQPEVVDPEDTEMLADLVIAAVNEAVHQAAETSEAEMSKVTGGMNLPGLFYAFRPHGLRGPAVRRPSACPADIILKAGRFHVVFCAAPGAAGRTARAAAGYRP